jgi:predicted sulfurtransferase
MAEPTAEKKRKVVRYKHTHTFVSRDIQAKDWTSVGADGQKAVVWDMSNNWEVPVDDFSPEALAYFKRDADFTITEV